MIMTACWSEVEQQVRALRSTQTIDDYVGDDMEELREAASRLEDFVDKLSGWRKETPANHCLYVVLPSSHYESCLQIFTFLNFNFYFPFRNLWFQSPLRIFRYVKPVSNSFIWISSLIRLLPFQFIVFVSITTKITNYIDLRHRIGYGFWLCCYTSATPMGSSCLVWNQLYLQHRTLSELVILWCIASRA